MSKKSSKAKLVGKETRDLDLLSNAEQVKPGSIMAITRHRIRGYYHHKDKDYTDFTRFDDTTMKFQLTNISLRS